MTARKATNARKPAPTRVVIMGAAGRDFHNFNTVFRDDPAVEVIAFTAAQIPGIAGRRYPLELAGPRYPQGIPILPEAELGALLARERIDQVVFAYSDVPHALVMHQASIALAAGADFALLGPRRTMLASRLPVIAICAVRTGVGKSQTARYLSRLLKQQGLRAAIVRHPMPYGDLAAQVAQRFATLDDLDRAHCTVEEREEYEPHIAVGNVVYAGVDYQRILQLVEAESDVIVWDGGNNDFSFYRPDLHIVLIDPLRAGHETTHHPGEAVLRMADVVLIAKTNSASTAAIAAVSESARRLAPRAQIVRAASRVMLDDPAQVRSKRVLVVEDGPTITHGGMGYGAGFLAAAEAGGEIINPRPFARGHLAAVFTEYPHIGNVIPAMGYSDDELADLRASIDASGADVVVAGTPCDLGRLLAAKTPIVRARYAFEEAGEPRLADVVVDFLKERKLLPKGAE